ncbi:MAG: hypothetical protein AAFQ68_11665 [Bacteroidota bacterium]
MQAAIPAGVALENSPGLWRINRWMDGRFQAQRTNYLRDELNLRSVGIRLRNEALYRLFNRNANPKASVGKNGFLFETTYLNAHAGLYDRPDSVLSQQAERIKALHDLLESQGTQLLVLLPPPKGYVYPEEMPDSYQRLMPTSNDRQHLHQQLTALGVPCMDFSFYKTERESYPALVYPKTGLHWSHYGAFVGVDSLRATLGRMLGKPLPRMQIDSLRFTNRLRPPDNELAVISNLWSAYPYDSLAYPHYHIESDSLTYQPNVLAIGDSYYRLWFDAGYLEGLFSPDSELWFYYGSRFKQAFPEGRGLDKSPEVLKASVTAADIVILEGSATFHHNLGFDFVEQYVGLFGQHPIHP